MKQLELTNLIDELVRGEISQPDHDRLQTQLKGNAEARSLFRERMDLEASLRTWAEETPTNKSTKPEVPKPEKLPPTKNRVVAFSLAIAAIAALALILILGRSYYWDSSEPYGPSIAGDDSEQAPQLVGVLREQRGCEWENTPIAIGERFATGKFGLAVGVAELQFDSGVNVTLEGPCELVVANHDSAQLKTGNVFVDVTEISNGFLLETPDARIIDEGTQYAVSLSEDSTEVHVFDGAVVWSPNDQSLDGEDRIEAGQARRYQRGRPAIRQHVPFGERQFVRRIEEELKQSTGESLLAYDGFENLAGQIRRDRSGFGWSGGWQQAGRGRGKLATVADAPAGVSFGIDRTDRRLLVLDAGNDIRRAFEQPLALSRETPIFVSFLVERIAPSVESEGSLQISLEPEATGTMRRRRTLGSFGFTTEGFPFTNIGNSINKTASPIESAEVCFVVVKLTVVDNQTHYALRVFRPTEALPAALPATWTIKGQVEASPFTAHSIRITVGEEANWHVDELKVGKTWNAVSVGEPNPR